MNTLVLRTDLAGVVSFGDVVDRVRETAVGAYAHQDLPFERLVEELQPDRDLSRTPLFQVMFQLGQPQHTGFGRGTLEAEEVVIEWATARFDLTLHFEEHPDGSLSGHLIYPTALFDRATVERMAGHYLALAGGLVAPGSLPVDQVEMITGEERRVLLSDWNATQVGYPASTLHEMVEAQVERTPDAVAVRFEDRQLTYAEVNAEANRLAHYLRTVGAGPESLVGVCLRRSVDLVVALLGVLKAGAGYVPLDPDHPAERLGMVLADAAVAVVLTVDSLAPAGDHDVVCLDRDAGLIRQCPAGNPEPLAGPGNVAYVMFTSGSTGRPKGVVIDHLAICNRIRWTQDEYGLDASDRVLQKTPYSFDVSVWEFFWPLTTGACLVVARPDGHRNPAYLAGVITTAGITTVHFVPSMLREFLAYPAIEGLPSLRRVLCSGEAMTPDLVSRFQARFAAGLYNLYGPTEAAVDVTAAPCSQTVVIGRPVANTRVYIVDSEARLVPVGVPGELVVAGVQLARGYLGRPAWTAERFVPDPFTPGGRLYRTGDLARLGPDGAVEYLGRLDDQVKIRGVRVELDEVANALTRLPGVAAAAAATHRSAGGDMVLVGYLVTETMPDSGTLRRRLAQMVPDAMIPTRWVTLDALPLNASGKLDRSALPRPSSRRVDTGQAHVPPRNPVERVLAEAFADAVGIAEVGVNDGFFAVGGDSIRVLRLVGTLRTQGYDVTVQDVFKHQTVAELGAVLSRATVEDQPTGRFELLDPTDRASLAHNEDIVDAYPLSMVQAGMLYEMQADSSLRLYHNVTCYTIRDDIPFSLPALRQAAQALADRHETLRTGIDLTTYAEPVQYVRRKAVLPVEYDDLRGHPDAEAVVRQAITDERGAPFDLRRPPLLRLRVYQITDTEWRLIVTECHAILDGWSHSLLLAELFAGHRGEPMPDTGGQVRVADAIALELRSLKSDEDREFWAGRVAGYDGPVLPEAWAGAQGGTPFSSVEIGIADLEPRLWELARTAGVPLKSVLLAAHLTVLGAVHGMARFRTGLVCNGRPETAGGEQVRGMFLNTVPFAADLDQTSWLALVRAVFAEEVELWPHRRYPLPAMQREWGRGMPLFDVFFNYLDFHVLDGTNLDTADTVDLTWNEFGLTVAPQPGLFVLNVATDRIGPDQLAFLARAYRQVAETMVADPDGDPRHWRLPDADRTRLLGRDTWNDTTAEFTDRPLPELFADQVRRTPDALAVACGGTEVSYLDLVARVNRLARHLRSLGVGPGVLVGVFLERGIDLLATMLGVLRSGGAYVPLDPAYPADRLGFMLADTGASTVVTQRRLVDRLPETSARIVDLDRDRELIGSRPPDEPEPLVEPDDLAYVIYTSGSTGRPKGVMITHSGLTNFLMAMLRRPGLTPGSPVAALTTVSFDPSVMELFLPLLVGAQVVIATPAQATDPHLIAELVSGSRAAVVQATPVTLRMLLDAGWSPPEGLTILCGGEKLPAELVRQLSAAGATVWDLYGPTETTVWSTTARMRADGTTEDWAAAANVTMHVLNRHLELAPMGVLGEIHIGGTGLAWGYLGRPGLTADRFIPDPHGTTPGARLYRTGDLARRHPDGRLEIVGRADHQVKIRGHRIEPAEIEAALLDHPGVHAVVVHPTPTDGGYQLTAYLVAAGTVPAATELREALVRVLPDYMIPAAFVVLEQFPLTATGKVDRGRLPVPRAGRTAKEYVAPRDQFEQDIADVWADVLGIPRIGVHENFFDLGGHSLLATRIAIRLRAVTGAEVPVRVLFDRPTIAALATALAEGATK